MKSKDKPVTVPEIARTDLKGLSTEELQLRLDAYCLQVGEDSQLQPVQDLLHELQVHQIELEMQSRELRESQRELEAARDRYADLYDFAPVCYINFDATGCIREINLAGAALLGQERGRLLGKPFSLWLKCGDNGQAFFSHLKLARESEQVETVELRLQPTRGTQLDVRLETVVSHEQIDGKPSFRCVVIDISARKLAERETAHQAQQLQLITDAIPAYIAYVDLQGVFQFANQAYAAWVRKSPEEIIGKKQVDVIWPSVYPKIEQYIHAALAGRPVNFEITIDTPEGETRDINASYIPDYANDGLVLGYFIVNRDVTELRRNEASDKMHLLETARVARINTMGEMVAEMAHELNQPLAAITIYSDAVRRMLDKDATNIPEMQGALSEIRQQASRAGEVIGRLREFVSKREVHNEQIQINTIIKEVMKLVAAEARWHGVMLILELGEAIPPVMVDRILIEQVILNLTRNAIEATGTIEQHKRCVTIKTSIGVHNEVVVAVEDTGPGMNVMEIENIFEPFYTTKTQGMGMGLAISRSIIRAHQGRLWAIANENGGMAFTFTLPYQPE
jgi:two-component system sensor kinase FixL